MGSDRGESRGKGREEWGGKGSLDMLLVLQK